MRRATSTLAARLCRPQVSLDGALRAATSVPARVYKLTDRGRIAPGLRADLVLVNGDPTTDILATRDIDAIWKRGVRVERTKPAAATAAAAVATTSGLIADFESADVRAEFGSGWQVSTDTDVNYMVSAEKPRRTEES